MATQKHISLNFDTGQVLGKILYPSFLQMEVTIIILTPLANSNISSFL